MEEKMKIMMKGGDYEIMGEQIPRYIIPKKGSVIPKERKLVKRMIFDQALQSLLSLFESSSSPFDSKIESNKETTRKDNSVLSASG